MTDKFWYLASPYSKYAHGLDAAYRIACEAVSDLMRARVPVFSPIAHGHGASVHGGVDPLSHDIWLAADEPFIRAAHGLVVLEANGWLESYGVNYEIRAFRDACKPIIHMAPGRVPAILKAAA